MTTPCKPSIKLTPAPASYSAKHRFAIAPMLDLTDKHYRYFARLLSTRALLYTEMVTTGAILYGRGDYLAFNEEEHPLALQLGGSNPEHLAACAKLAQQRGYDEINLNVGCPSDRVQSGRFGACLMAEPTLVAQCVDAMKQVVDIPVTVKTRIGIDEQDSYEFLCQFIDTVTKAGCSDFTLHARKAWLKGLSPKQNRDIPPLDYSRVYQLKRDYPQLNLMLNGGITSLEQSQQHLQHVNGVMVGREAYQNPYILAEVDNNIYQQALPVKTREQVLEQLYPYIQAQLNSGARLNHISRHIIGLYQGLPGSRRWRRYISDHAHKAGAGVEVIIEAQQQMGSVEC